VAVIARFLIDTSAGARMRLDTVAERLEPLLTGGLVATCATLEAEALYSVGSPRSTRRSKPVDVLPTATFLPTTNTGSAHSTRNAF